jgi:hypothetical protein
MAPSVRVGRHGPGTVSAGPGSIDDIGPTPDEICLGHGEREGEELGASTRRWQLKLDAHSRSFRSIRVSRCRGSLGWPLPQYAHFVPVRNGAGIIERLKRRLELPHQESLAQLLDCADGGRLRAAHQFCSGAGSFV